jgi:hypothetical protein
MISRRRKSATHKRDIKIRATPIVGRPGRDAMSVITISSPQHWSDGLANFERFGPAVELVQFLRERVSLRLEFICTRGQMPICGSERALAPPPHTVGGERSPRTHPCDQQRGTGRSGSQPCDQHVRARYREGGGQSHAAHSYLVLMFSRRLLKRVQ